MSNNRDSLNLLSTQPITIYQRTYYLPVLTGSNFSKLQHSIKSRQQIIREGKKNSPKLFGLVIAKENVDFEERFIALEQLIKDYDLIITFLQQHKETYELFLKEITQELQLVVKEKCQEIARYEKERQELAKEIDANNQQLQHQLQVTLKQEIYQNAYLLAKASILTIKKLELIGEGIKKLTEDSDIQQGILIDMLKDLEDYRKVYRLQVKIKKQREEITKIADVAINLEQYLKDYLEPFQGLIDKVVTIDRELSTTVQEIKFLVGDLMGNNNNIFAINPDDNFSDKIIEFLVITEEKKEGLTEALEKAKDTGWECFQLPLDTIELSTTLEAIQVNLAKEFSRYLQASDVNITQDLLPVKNIASPHISPTQSLENQSFSLVSDINLDYSNLRDLLFAKEWKKADLETNNLLLKAAIRQKQRWFRVEDMENLPSTDLQTIDNLWMFYSNGYFGFSIQREIYLSLGGIQKFDREIWQAFGDTIGWRVNNQWLNYGDLFVSSLSIHGCLPAKIGFNSSKNGHITLILRE